MKLGFYCFDHAGGDALKIVAEEAISRGHQVVNPAKQMPVSEEAMIALMGCDVVVTGLSSFKTEMELEVVRQLDPKISWIVFPCLAISCRNSGVNLRSEFASIFSTTLCRLAPRKIR